MALAPMKRTRHPTLALVQQWLHLHCADPIPHPMKRVALRLAPLALIGVLACKTDDKAPAATSDIGGTMVVVQPEPTTLFPPRMNSTEGLAIIDAVFDHLAEIGPDLSVAGDKGYSPRLARSWEWAKDSLSIAFALDPKARWHDGAPVRAKDVQYTFAVYTADSVASETKSLLGNIDSVSVRDSLTAVFWFKRRLPHQFFDATYHMYILPSHLLDTISMERVSDAPFGRAPVGSGRFRFGSWERGARVEIVADTTNSRGRAKLDRVIWTFSSDFGAATVKLFSGDADFYQAIRPENLAEVARSTTLKLIPAPSLEYGFLAYNMHARKSTTAPHPIFGDVRVRRAFAMAVDRARMERNVYDTLGSVALAAAPRVLIPDTAALRQLAYDTLAARALLDSAGWKLSGTETVRTRNGQRLTFELLAAKSSASRQRYAVLLQEQLRPLGVDVQVRVVDGRAMGQAVEGHNYDSWLSSLTMTPGRLGLPQTWATGGDMNYGGYSNPALDATIDSAITAFDPTRSRTMWTRVFQSLIDEQPGLFLYEPRSALTMHKRILPAPLRADAWYANLADWSIDPNQRIDRDKGGLGSAR